MADKNKYIALFDLDKTILNSNSGSFLVKEAFRQGMLSRSGLLRAIYISILYKFNLRKTSLLISGMGEWLKGFKVEEIDILCDSVTRKYLIDSIRPEISAEIEYHKSNNAEVVILSSAMDRICNGLSKFLGMDSTLCTTMESRKGVLTGDPVGEYCFEDEKRVRLLDYCKKMAYNLDEAFYYGDSIADLPALKVVGNPVCVDPDKKLIRIARRQNWRIVEC